MAPRKKPVEPQADHQDEPVTHDEQDTTVVVEKPVFPTPQ